jgi:hypothetical protein
MKTAMGLVLAMFAGAAAAGDLSEPRYHESSDFSARVYYRVDFGGQAAGAQSLGLRVDSVRAEAAGAPSLLQLNFGAQGVDRVAVNGVDLRGAMVSSSQSGGGFFASLSGAQWVALAFTVVVFGSVAADATESTDDPSGTGGS